MPLDDSLDKICREQRQQLKPYALRYYFGRRVECISYPWVENGCILINVRMTVNDPTTMRTIPANRLAKHWIRLHCGLGTVGMTVGGLYFDFFLRPYFGMFTATAHEKIWRSLPTFKIVKVIS